jgi:hypothetical protein
VEEQSGFGVIELPADAQWLVLPPGDGRNLLLRSGGVLRLSSQIAEAAQRYDAKAKAPTLESFVPADAPLLPPGFVSRVVAKVSLYGRVADGPGSNDLDLVAPLDLHDAVFGAGASADATLDLGQIRYTLHATLTPSSPRSPTSARTTDAYAGTLVVHVEDDRGHAWQHAYPASGRVELEGEAVVAPYGLQIPGASGPSPEYEARHGRLPGFARYTAVDLHLDVELSDDPRR